MPTNYVWTGGMMDNFDPAGIAHVGAGTDCAGFTTRMRRVERRRVWWIWGHPARAQRSSCHVDDFLGDWRAGARHLLANPPTLPKTGGDS